MRFWLPILAASFFTVILLWPWYSGDAIIYLCYAQNLARGYGLVLNQGEFSSGLTSPLWGLILSVCFIFSRPEVAAKLLGVTTLLLGLWVGRKVMPEKFIGEIGLMIVFAFAISPSMLFFETGLLVLVCFAMIGGYKWAIPILPFVRPEGILFSLAAIIYRKQWVMLLWLLPIGAYWTASWILTGYFSTSVVFRSRMMSENLPQNFWLFKRYVVILLPFLAYGISRLVAKRGKAELKHSTLTYALIVGLILSTNLWDSTHRSWKSLWRFDYITAKSTAAKLNVLARRNATVLCNEVQFKYWLRPDIKMLSLDGITDGKVDKNDIEGFIARQRPDYYIPTAVYTPWFYRSILFGLKGDTITFQLVKFINRVDYYELRYSSQR